MRGSLSVALRATAGLALLCTALFGNQARPASEAGLSNSKFENRKEPALLGSQQALPTSQDHSKTPLLQPTLGFRLHDVTTRQAGSAGHHSEAPASIITVTSTADTGAGSLRTALFFAIDGDTIQFD